MPLDLQVKDPVEAAFQALVVALRTAALEEGGDFDRTAAFIRAAQQQAARWASGAPTHTVRAGKAGGGSVT